MNYPRHVANLLRDRYRGRGRGPAPIDPKVMVIEAARCLYVPVPKAANSSARLALCPSVGIDPATVTDVHKDDRLPIARFGEVAGRFDGQWFAFTIVRDPVARARSAWRNKVRDRGAALRALKAMGVEAGDGFETLLAACARWPLWSLNDHFLPQSDLLRRVAATGRLTVLRAEDLPGAWEGIAARIVAAGAPRPAPIGWINRTEDDAAAPDEPPSPRAARLLARLYAEDFAAYDYPRPGAARAPAGDAARGSTPAG